MILGKGNFKTGSHYMAHKAKQSVSEYHIFQSNSLFFPTSCHNTDGWLVQSAEVTHALHKTVN